VPGSSDVAGEGGGVSASISGVATDTIMSFVNVTATNNMAPGVLAML
jgi:hypothetical protein